MRKMVVTFDDLPIVSMDNRFSHLQCATNRLLEKLVTFKVPAIGFVNENKLYKNGRLDKKMTGLLQKWLDAGFDLGNHSYSHKRYSEVSFLEYKEDIIKGEKITNKLLAKQNRKAKYFRNPYLDVGDSLEKKSALEKFLKEYGYKIAPVTVDNWDWQFAIAYEKALKKKHKDEAKKIGKDYIASTETNIVCREQESVDLFGREISQILLLHTNTINADYLGDLLQMIQKRGYQFISIDEALIDSAYQSPNAYVTYNTSVQVKE